MKRELGSLPGVEEVQTDIPTQHVTLRLDTEQMTPEEAKKQMERIGFPVE
ncbi:MAG: cation transporter [Dehalococcoidia bacterium]